MNSKKPKSFGISLRNLLSVVVSISLVVFFLIAYMLIRMQSSTIIDRAYSQLQGEISRNIQENIVVYMQNAARELKSVSDIMSNENIFSDEFDEEVFLSLLDNFLKEDENINALYFGKDDGSFYMSKRVATGVVSRRIVKNNGSKVISQWIHPPGSNVENDYIPYTETDIKIGYDPRKRSWYQLAQSTDSDTIEWTDPYIFFTDSLFGITATKKIDVPYFKGVIGVDVSLAYLRNFLDNLLISSLGSILIVDDNNSVIALSDYNNKAYNKIYTEIITDNGNKAERVPLKVGEIDSSDQMQYFVNNIVNVSEVTLLEKDRKKRNLLELLVNTIFVKHAQSKSLKNLLVGDLNLFLGIFKNKGHNYVYTYNKLSPGKGLSWRVYTMIDRKVFSSTSDFMTVLIGWFFFGFLVIMVFILLKTTKIITAPLGVIANLMTSLKQLKLDNYYKNNSKVQISEIQNIGETYNNLVTGLTSFKKFIPESIVRQSIDNSDKALTSHMERKEDVTILFTDIKGFTTITESTRPKVLCECLDYYFSEIGASVGKNNGMIDKFIGDAVMAIYGNFGQKNSAIDALHTALEIKQKISHINEVLQKKYNDVALNFTTRIGISTGDAMLGILGSDVRLNYTAIGDIVNLASRLEGLNKEYGTLIIASSETVKQSNNLFVFRFLDSVQVKGKNNYIDAYQLIGTKKDVPLEAQEYIKKYEEAYRLYLDKKYTQAMQVIETVESSSVKVQDAFLIRLKQKIIEIQK